MDSWFDQNQSMFGVFIFSELLQVLSNANSFLDQAVNILWNLWGSTYVYKLSTMLLQKTYDLLSSEELDAGDGFLISDGNTDLGWRHSLFGHGDNKVRNRPGGVCDPTSVSSFKRSNSWADTFSFSFALYSTHFFPQY